MLLNSLVATYDERYTFTVYFGYDYEDPYFDHEPARKAFDGIADAMIGQRAIRIDWTPFFAFRGLTHMWNLLAEKGYVHGNCASRM